MARGGRFAARGRDWVLARPVVPSSIRHPEVRPRSQCAELRERGKATLEYQVHTPVESLSTQPIEGYVVVAIGAFVLTRIACVQTGTRRGVW